jgi:hypothetical protein
VDEPDSVEVVDCDTELLIDRDNDVDIDHDDVADEVIVALIVREDDTSAVGLLLLVLDSEDDSDDDIETDRDIDVDQVNVEDLDGVSDLNVDDMCADIDFVGDNEMEAVAEGDAVTLAEVVWLCSELNEAFSDAVVDADMV